MHLYGLIGNPLSHSFSKKYFSEKFEKEGLPGYRYEEFPLSSIKELPALLAEQPSLEGLNVTIPYKQQVLPYLHDRSGIPSGLMACNCIRIQNKKLYGYNTDHTGFEKSLNGVLLPGHTKALVLGSGGAATAIVFVLKKMGISYRVVSRRLQDNVTMNYEDVNEQVLKEYSIIINTTPLGMYPNVNEYPPIPYEFIGSGHLLFDLTYNPAETLFLKKGKERGAHVKNGEEMLVLQAEESWRIWRG
jgi:shikimate dehydrogenase